MADDEWKTLECALCDKPIEDGQRIVAFDEYLAADDEWEDIHAGIHDGFEEIEPASGSWLLAHYHHFFKEAK